VLRSNDALGEDKIDDEEQDDAGVYRDLRCDADFDVCGMEGPCYPAAVGEYSGEAEAFGNRISSLSTRSKCFRHPNSPNSIPHKMNFLPFRALYFNRNMCPAPARMKRTRKTAHIGASGRADGVWPSACSCGGYGLPWASAICCA